MTRNASSKIDLARVLKGRAPGDWVVFSLSLARIVGTGKTAKEAVAHARANRRPIKDPILLCVLEAR